MVHRKEENTYLTEVGERLRECRNRNFISRQELARRANGYGGGYHTSGGGCSTCDICSGLMCADCCCECMGGDLIRCC